MAFKWLTTTQVSLQVIQGVHLHWIKVTLFSYREHSPDLKGRSKKLSAELFFFTFYMDRRSYFFLFIQDNLKYLF